MTKQYSYFFSSSYAQVFEWNKKKHTYFLRFTHIYIVYLCINIIVDAQRFCLLNSCYFSVWFWFDMVDRKEKKNNNNNIPKHSQTSIYSKKRHHIQNAWSILGAPRVNEPITTLNLHEFHSFTHTSVFGTLIHHASCI